MKRIIKDTLILFVITLVAGILLGGVYKITKAPIEAQVKAKTEKAYKAVFEKYFKLTMDKNAAQAEVDKLTFNEWSDEDVAGITSTFDELCANPADKLDGVVTVKDDSGNVFGYVISVTNSEAYGGSIGLSVGILNTDGKVAGVEILSISETPGLGMNADKDGFKGQFTGVDAMENGGFVYTKTGKQAPNEIDAISSATFTTRSMVNGVNAALNAYMAIMLLSTGGVR